MRYQGDSRAVDNGAFPIPCFSNLAGLSEPGGVDELDNINTTGGSQYWGSRYYVYPIGLEINNYNHVEQYGLSANDTRRALRIFGLLDRVRN